MRGLAVFGEITQAVPNPLPNQTTVPEPSETIGTLAFGALGVGFVLKRKLKK